MDLFLIVKTEWYDMIEALIKKDEYRDITPYWEKRLYNFDVVSRNSSTSFKKPTDLRTFDTVTFQRGYSAANGRMQFECKGIEIRNGKPEWGAAPGQDYFCIKLGDRLFDGSWQGLMSKKGYRRGTTVHYVPHFQPHHDTLPGNFELTHDRKEIISYEYPKEQRDCFDRHGFYTVYHKREGWVKIVNQ